MLRGRAPAAAAPIAVDDMPTQEFVALRAAVLARGTDQRACGRRPPRRAHAPAQATHA
jgi:hypothetical protein